MTTTFRTWQHLSIQGSGDAANTWLFDCEACGDHQQPRTEQAALVLVSNHTCSHRPVGLSPKP